MAEDLTSNDKLDAVRIYRMFTGAASAYLGIEPDQNYANEDAVIYNATGTHAAADPYRGAAVIGTTRSFGQTGAADAGLVITPGLILLGVGLFFLLRSE